MSASTEEKAEEKENKWVREKSLLLKKWENELTLIISNLEGKKTNKILSIFYQSLMYLTIQSGNCGSQSRKESYYLIYIP